MFARSTRERRTTPRRIGRIPIARKGSSITDQTQPVTFDVTLTPQNNTQLVGAATTGINYQDFALAILDVPIVDEVADEMRLELDFVARAVS